MMKRNRLLAVALVAACANGAMAMDVAGFAFTGYTRGGPLFNHPGGVKGGLSLGGELQKYRLGNEGGNRIEVSGFSLEPEAKFWAGQQYEVWS